MAHELRMALVIGSEVVFEGWVPGAATVGRAAGATMRVDQPGVGEAIEVLRLVDGAQCLCLESLEDGVVQMQGDRVPLADLRRHASVRDGVLLPLTVDCRGRVDLRGGGRVLFRFRDPEPWPD